MKIVHPNMIEGRNPWHMILKIEILNVENFCLDMNSFECHIENFLDIIKELETLDTNILIDEDIRSLLIILTFLLFKI